MIYHFILNPKSGKKKKSPPGFSRQSFEKLEEKLCESENLAQEAARLIGENSDSRNVDVIHKWYVVCFEQINAQRK